MLHYLTHPSCGLLAVCGILLIATIGAPLVCKDTDFAKRPDLGFFEGHRLIFEGMRVEREAEREDSRCFPHQCVCDFERSEIVYLKNNTVSLKCAVARCGRTMVVGQDLARQYPLDHVESFR